MSKISTIPTVSVCIPVYNGAEYIEETIKSVLEQTFSNTEVIVNDNQSIDDTSVIVENLCKLDKRVKLFRSARLLSMANNWNDCVNKSTGQYVCLLSADDIMAPEFLSDCLSVFQSYPNVDVVTANHEILKGLIARPRRVRVNEGLYSNCPDLIMDRNPFSINFSMFKREGLGPDPFKRNLLACDYDLWLRHSLNKKNIYYISKPLGKYRVHESNLSRNKHKMIRHALLVFLSYRILFKEKRRSSFFLLLKLSFRYFIVWSFARATDKKLKRALLKSIYTCVVT